MSLLANLWILLAQAASPGCGDIDGLIDAVDQGFKRGELEAAVSQADLGLSCSNATVDQRIILHLKLSGIHDRIGLHTHSRPVAAALRHVEAALDMAEQASPTIRSAVSLAEARYHYRAESPDSDFPRARESCRSALAQFEELGDFHGQADAVHLLGLFHLQRREWPEAREYFDRSLELEQQSGMPRPIFLADYERHVGYLHQAAGELATAIVHFERSFIIRRDSGLIDQSMFGAISFARVLVSAKRATEARAPLDYALKTADAIGSPEGRLRAGLVLGDMYDQLGEREAAIQAYEATLALARQRNRAPIVERAITALARLRD